MNYVIGALVGLILGGVIGYLKNFFVWQRYIKRSDARKADSGGAGGVYVRVAVNYGIDLITLAGAFFLGRIQLIDRVAVLIATAVMLSLMSIVLSLRQQRKMRFTGEEESGNDRDA